MSIGINVNHRLTSVNRRLIPPALTTLYHQPMVDRGARIKMAVDALGTQRHVAELMGVTPQSVGKWIKQGTIEVDNLYKLSKLSGISFFWLAFAEGPERIDQRYDVAPPPHKHGASESPAKYAIIGGTEQPLVIPPDCADIVHELIQANLATTLGKQMLFALRQIIRAHAGQPPLPPEDDPVLPPVKRNVSAMAAKATPPARKN